MHAARASNHASFISRARAGLQVTSKGPGQEQCKMGNKQGTAEMSLEGTPLPQREVSELSSYSYECSYS